MLACCSTTKSERSEHYYVNRKAVNTINGITINTAKFERKDHLCYEYLLSNMYNHGHNSSAGYTKPYVGHSLISLKTMVANKALS